MNAGAKRMPEQSSVERRRKLCLKLNGFERERKFYNHRDDDNKLKFRTEQSVRGEVEKVVLMALC
jgi:hypothetical protein